jgi:inhibitor of cysteine peptidase
MDNLRTFSAPDRGKTEDVAVGTKFCVELSENPTTGHRWSQPELDGTSVVPESDEFAPAAGAGVGGGGTRRFTFLMSSSGKTTIRLAYRRSWDTSGEPSQRFDITLVGSS